MNEMESATIISKTLAPETQGAYSAFMADFLDVLRRRKMQLRKELADVETAERVYMDAAARGEVLTGADKSAHDLFERMARMAQAESAAAAVRFTPKNIQQMVLHILDEIYPGGLTSLEILDQIQRRWKPDLMRTSLSPQLSRLRKGRSIKNDKHKWYLAVKNETGAPADAPA